MKDVKYTPRVLFRAADTADVLIALF